MEAEEGAEGWEAAAPGLWVLRERDHPPALPFFSVHGWGVAESWRKSCLCFALALSLALFFFFFRLRLVFCRSGLQAATVVQPWPSLLSGDVSGVRLMSLSERVKYTGSLPSQRNPRGCFFASDSLLLYLSRLFSA